MTAVVHPIRDDRRHSARWLRDILHAQVMQGDFTEGLLPRESDLMLAHALPRVVVREALELLRRQGVVERVKGAGTLAVAQRYSSRLVEAHGVEPMDDRDITNRVLVKRTVPMPRLVAEQLDSTCGDQCLLYEYVGYIGGKPSGVYTNYITYPEADAAATAAFPRHWYSMLAAAGLEVGETELTIDAMVADAALGDLIGVAPGQPVLGLQQVIRDNAGRPYNFAILRSRGDRLSLVSRHSRADYAGVTR